MDDKDFQKDSQAKNATNSDYIESNSSGNTNSNVPYSVVPDPIKSYSNANNVYTYAGFWLRFAAVIVDGLIIALPVFILFIFFLSSSLLPSIEVSNSMYSNIMFPHSANIYNNWLSSFSKFSIITFIFTTLYNAFFESSKWQGTPGKKVLGLIVTDMQGNRITFLRALVRNASKYISKTIFYIGYIMSAFTEKKQALHDFISSTFVLRKV